MRTLSDAVMSVRISPPFWLTWYAYLIYGLLALLLAFSVDRYQRRQMKAELDKGNISDAKEMVGDVIQNLEKITHHGKRADEYLRLSYHGLRAKDKSFNSGMETDFDPALGPVNIIQQDIGRVILNLLTNAFHAVNEKKKDQPDGSTRKS